jgi:hypothetical protein
MEESQLQDMASSFMFHGLMYLINNLGKWDISFDYMDRNPELNVVASLAIQRWTRWTEGEIDGKKFMRTIMSLEEVLVKEGDIENQLSNFSRKS